MNLYGFTTANEEITIKPLNFTLRQEDQVVFVCSFCAVVFVWTSQTSLSLTI
jgi:hypothetical protein